MNEVTTNKNNWTGESVTVQYDDAGRFEYAGYSFQVGPFEAFGSEVLKGEGLRSLTGSSWGTEPLTRLHVSNESLEQAII
jgi:hypothetical protein